MDTPSGFRDQYVLVGAHRLHFWTAGAGPRAVVLIHGLGSSIEEWLLAIPALAARFRVYALDLPGHGSSDTPDLRYTPVFYAESVLAFLRAQGLGHVCLAGRSLGGGVCLELAAAHPGIVDRLVLLAPPGLGRELALPLRLLTVPLLGEYMTRPGRPATPRPKWMERLPPEVTEALMDARSRSRQSPGARRALLRTLRESAGLRGVRRAVLERARERLGEIRAPVLLVWGDLDVVVPLAHGRAALGLLADARLEVVASCGHQSPLEQPETVNRLIAEFLA